MDDQRSIPGRGGVFSLHQHVHTGSVAHPVVDVRSSFRGGKVTRVSS